MAILGCLAAFAPSASANAGFVFYLHGVRAIPGTSYFPMETTEPIDLTEHWLFLVRTSPRCDHNGLPAGQVYTLISSTGGLSGALNTYHGGDEIYDELPDGGELGWFQEGHYCGGSVDQRMRINYHESGPVQTVTATVVGGSSTPRSEFTISGGSGSLETNQPVTVTASVLTTSGTPSGAVTFTHRFGFNDKDKCANRPVVKVDSSFEASCVTSFSPSEALQIPPGPHDVHILEASFTPTDSEELLGSRSNYDPATVAAPTTTDIQASNATPTLGENVTYTATVTPADYLGPVVPSGAVEFLDNGEPIAQCTDQPLSADGTSAAATCEVEELALGEHSLTASYAGDVNFTLSSAPAVNVTVEPPKAPAAAPKSHEEPAPTGAGAVLGFTATNGLGGSSAIGGPQSAPPRPSIALTHRRIFVRGQHVGRVTLECGNAPCHGKLLLSAHPTGPKGARAMKAILGTATFTIPANHSARVPIKLTASGRKRLRAGHGRLAATLTAAGLDLDAPLTLSQGVELLTR